MWSFDPFDSVRDDEFERVFEESRVTMLPVPCLTLLSTGLRQLCLWGAEGSSLVLCLTSRLGCGRG